MGSVSPLRLRRHPWRLAAPLAVLAASAAVYACTSAQASEADRARAAAAVRNDTAAMGFRSAVTAPPPGWTGPVFQLSDDYPTSAPGRCAQSTCPWLYRQVDFQSGTPPQWQGAWADYMNDIFQYVKRGQTLSPQGWNAQVDGQTRWFHVPWMAYDSVHGREFVHGMTNERSTDLSDFFPPGRGRTNLHAGRVPGAANGLTTRELPKGLHTLLGASDTTRQFESWAVGFYNPYGAYAIGQTIPQSGVPQAVRLSNGSWGGRGMPFPEGTVVAKILFTTATPQDVSFLRGSPQWIADRHVQTGPSTYTNQRRPQPVYLAQMDVGVRDDRSPTGWVYGTFAYNGRLLGASPWDRMAPVGLQWGSDPQSWPAQPAARARPITQSVIAPISIPQHLGCLDRLAGPIDNPKSSCMSCHQGAYAPAPVGTQGSYGRNIPPIFGFTNICVRTSTTPDSTNRMNYAYFQNVRYPAQYPPFPKVSGPTINLDSSLQLQVAFLQYANWLAAQRG